MASQGAHSMFAHDGDERMIAHAVAAALAAAVALANGAEPPRTVVHQALQAVEGDSVDRVAARWRARVAHAPVSGASGDRAALLGLATLARLTYAYADASRGYRMLALPADRPPDGYAVYAGLGDALVLDAENSTEAGRGCEAARLMARALGDREAEGEALAEAAFARVNATQSVAAGLAGLDTALRLLPDAATEARAHALRYRALFLTVTGERTAAAVDSAARALARRAGSRREEAQTYRVEALRLKLAGQPAAGLAALTTAESLHRAARDRSGLALTMLYHAERLADQGSYGAATATARTALGVAGASRFAAGVAGGWSTLGGIALRTGDVRAAGTSLATAESLFTRQHDPANAVIARGQLAELSLRAGDLATARARAQMLADWFRHTGEAEGEFGARSMLVTIAMRARDAGEVAHSLGDAEALVRRQHAPPWSTSLSLTEGRVALWRGDAGGAEEWIGRYLATLDTAAHVARHDARVTLADAHARRGDLSGAERELSAATDELDRWRATLTDDRVRVLAFQASAGDAAERDASVARVIARLAAGGRAPAAFALAERRRARTLADRLARATALGTSASASPSARTPVWVAPGTTAGTTGGALSADRLRAAIPDAATAVVEYVTAGEGAPTTVFVLTRGAFHAYALAPADSVAGASTRLVTLLERGDAPAPLERALGAALLDSAVAGLAPTVRRLLVVPDGPLHGVPFDALRLGDGRYVVERFALAVTPSAGVAAALWARAGAATQGDNAPIRLLAFGDPMFGNPTSGIPTSGTPVLAAHSGDAPRVDANDIRGDDPLRAGFDASGGLPRLTGAGDEARDVARYASDAEVRLGADASAAYLTRTPLTGYRVLHFATHALVDDGADTRTALALAPGAGVSGFVTPADLAALRLDADMVVLSACRTAGGALVTGEGVQGLTAPLLAAGARSVVATAWRIGDRPTVTLVHAFYSALARGLPVADALRAAQLDAIQRGAAPREWAAFTVVGNPLTRVGLRAPRPPTRWPLVAGGAALVATLGVVLLGGGVVRVRRGRGGALTV